MRNHVRRAGLAALLALAFVAPACAADAPCRLPRIGQIVPRFDHGRILIPARLNGTDVFFFFTNATDSWIRADVADRLAMGHMHLPSDVFVFVGGSKRVPERRTAELSVGGLYWHAFAFLPSPKGYSENPDVVGTIGGDAFLNADVDLEFNLAAGLINVIAHNDCAAPPWANGAAPIAAVPGDDGVEFSVMLDGERLRAIVAPALAQTQMPSSTARAHFGLVRDTEHEDPEVHGPATLIPHTFSALQLAGTTLTPLDVAIVRQYAPPRWSYAPPVYPFWVEPLDLIWFDSSDPAPSFIESPSLVLLGVSDLRRLRLYFALRKRLLFAIPVAPAP